MMFAPVKKFSLILSLMAGLVLWHGANAGTPAEVPARPLAASDTNVPAVLIPKLKSPVEAFRNLLAMSPAERRRALTNRPPEVQKRILAKLLEKNRPNRNDGNCAWPRPNFQGNRLLSRTGRRTTRPGHWAPTP